MSISKWISAVIVVVGLTFASSVSAATTLFESVQNLGARPIATSLCSGCSNNGAGSFKPIAGFRLTENANVTAIKVTVGNPCCAQSFIGPFNVYIYDGGVTDADAPLIFEQNVRAVGYAQPNEAAYTSVNTDWDTAIVAFSIASPLLRKNHDYSISFFIPNGFKLAAFNEGSSPLWNQVDPASTNDADRFQQMFYNSSGAAVPGSLGFRLDGVVSTAPEPGTWALMIVGVGMAGTAS